MTAEEYHYSAMSASLLFVDELPQGAYAHYEKDYEKDLNFYQLAYMYKWGSFRLTNIKIIRK